MLLCHGFFLVVFYVYLSVAMLLAVDLGLKAGFAVYNTEGQLQSYRSKNFGAPSRLKRGAYRTLQEHPELTWVVLEGDRAMAEAWQSHADRNGLSTGWIQASTWRKKLLNPSERRTGSEAKAAADTLARKVIEWSGAPRPTSLRHDAAEAICIGLWSVLNLGWLERHPRELR